MNAFFNLLLVFAVTMKIIILVFHLSYPTEKLGE